MKKLLLLLLSTAGAVASMAQVTVINDSYQRASYTDPTIENFRLSDADNGAVNTELLDMGRAVKTQFTIENPAALQTIPAGSCKVVLSLGSKFTVATNMNDAAQLPLSQYFKWTAGQAAGSGQVTITGDLYKDLPAKFAGKIAFMLMPKKLGTSTIVCQLQITNDNSAGKVLSDMNPNNNYASLSYTNVKPLERKFIRFSSVARGCLLDLNWAIYDEEKAADKLVIETSTDGTNFTPVQTIPASGGVAYGYMLDQLTASNLTVRIKAAKNNGQYVYSEKITNSNICTPGFEAAIYPNPVARDATEATVVAKTGIFNGKYSIKITNAGGTEMRRTEATYNNQVQVKVTTGVMAAGMYFITLTCDDGKPVSLKMVKQ